MNAAGETSQRLDRWLWFARFFKNRTLATRFVASGHLRINGERVVKAHYGVRIADVLTFAQGPHVRVIRVAALGIRRGPASEARTLYDDLEPPPVAGSVGAAPIGPETAPTAERPFGTGRPTKADRRALDRLRGRE